MSRRPGGYPGQIPGQERRGKRRLALAEDPPAKGNGLDHNDDERVIDVVAGKRHLAAIAGMGALADASVPFYQRGGELVRPVRLPAKDAYERDMMVPGLLAVRAPMVAHELGASARWRRYTADGEERTIDPPKEVVDQILGALVHRWPFPAIKGIVCTPTMRMDGSLLLAPGFDRQTGLYLMDPPAMPAIPEAPSREDAVRAADLLEALLGEFPFSDGDDGPSASVALSMLMTPVLRAALAPAVPIHLATAPQPGTGKSFLADLSAAIAIGERCPVFAASAKPNETETRLEGAALKGFPIIALDNVNGELTGSFLAQLASQATLAIRNLGGHPITTVANTFTVFANGNNITAPLDLIRRSIRCGLDANMERPWERVFKADPVEIVLADRGPYVAACLTIARAYIVAGVPGRKRPPAGFKRWSDIVRSALCWLGYTDPCDSTPVVAAESSHDQDRAALFTLWHQTLGETRYTAAEVAKVADQVNHNPDAGPIGYVYPDFREALVAVADPKNIQQVNPRSLGKYLHRNNNVLVGNLKLTIDESDERRQKYGIAQPRKTPAPHPFA